MENSFDTVAESMIMKDGEGTDFRQEFYAYEQSLYLHRPLHFEDSFCNLIDGMQSGTPFSFDNRLAFRPGEVTVLGGINGHGKSLFSGQIALQLIANHQSVAIFSFEMLPARTLFRMARQVIGHVPGKADKQKALEWLYSINRNLILMDAQGAVDAELILGATLVSSRDHGCSVIIIDNLAKVVAGEDDFTGQKMFVQKLTDMARHLSVHIILVHHVRKSGKESDGIDKFSFKGSGSIIDQVDNAILIQRNLEKEAEAEDGKLNAAMDQDKADVIVRVVKQRNGDWTGKLGLWFEPISTTYCKSVTRTPLLR